jgi:glycosyltransferase involved in cell wall biosynthesis
MSKRLSTSVIIPTLNEEESISQVLSRIPWELVSEVLVVDGGSSDNTVALAQASRGRVIHEPRRGYGQACASGVAEASGEVIVFLDADGANDPKQINELLEPMLKNNGAELVLGSRLIGEISPGAMPWHQRFGNWLSAKLIQLLYGEPLSDLSPFRAVLRSKLLNLELKDMTYGYPTEMIVKAARRGWHIVEIPVNYYPRIGGKSKISGTIRGTILATYHILATILRYTGERPEK